MKFKEIKVGQSFKLNNKNSIFTKIPIAEIPIQVLTGNEIKDEVLIVNAVSNQHEITKIQSNCLVELVA